jgi:non-specific serine/threonine protein kinase
MTTLHAIWWQDKLHVWGEGPPRESSSASSTSNTERVATAEGDCATFAVGHGGPTLRPIAHPAALPVQDLHALLGEVSRDALLAAIAEESSLTLWLPCANGRPLPSAAPDLTPTAPAGEDDGRSAAAPPADLGIAGQADDAAALQPVTVPTLAFSPADTLDLLMSLPKGYVEQSGGSLRYWRGLTEFLLSLLARQQFVPDVEQLPDGACVARWRVYVRDRRELAWLERYTAAMPPLCRAVVIPAARDDAPGRLDMPARKQACHPGRPHADFRARPTSGTLPTALVDEFLLAAADAVIRRILAHDPFFEQMHRRAREDRSWELCWLAALVGDDPLIRAPREQTIESLDGVRSWTGGPEAVEDHEPPALCFALLEPDDTPDAQAHSWRVRFELRSTEDDKALEVGSTRLPEGEALGVLGRHILRRQRHLTAELVRAAQAFPLLRAALHGAEADDADLSELAGGTGDDQPAPDESEIPGEEAEDLSGATPSATGSERDAAAGGTGHPVVRPGVEVSTNEAHAFIHEWAPMLRAQGYRVTLPPWAERPDRRLGMVLYLRPAERQPDDDVPPQSAVPLGRPGGRAPASDAVAETSTEEQPDPAITTIGLSSMLSFNWRVAIGDEHLSAEEFERIAASEAPLVRIRGRWIDIDPQAARQALDFLHGQRDGRITLAEAIRQASGVDDLDTGLPVVGLSGTSWIERFFTEPAEPAVDVLEQPSSFHGLLRPYQRTGLSWLAFLHRLGIGACLADDMGLGKTIQLIALLLHERGPAEVPVRESLLAPGEASTWPVAPGRSGPKGPVGPTLLFAPMSVVGNWEREIARFGPSLRVLVHHGPERLTGNAFVQAAAKHDVVITTYGLAQRDFKTLSRVRWYRLVLDEAQKIKNPSALQTVSIRALRGDRRVALTGTPIENHLSELWSIMEFLNPGLLGTAGAFRNRLATPIERLGDRRRAEQLRRMIRPFVLRRLKSDPKVICDLPEKMEMRVYCNLTPEQAAHYERLVDVLLKEVDSAAGIRRRGLILATLTRLKQVCNHPTHLLRDAGSLDGRSGKCERLTEMLEEVLETGDAALVFTQFREMGDLLVRLLRDRLRIHVPFLHGGTPQRERERMIQAFQDPAGEDQVFLLSLKAGGFGLNLTKANHVFHFDRWWNPAVEDQATDRAHRIGQTRRVQVHKFVCIGTIEDRIDQLLTEKAALADRIVGSGDEWLTGMSTTELRDYLHLSREAIAEA